MIKKIISLLSDLFITNKSTPLSDSELKYLSALLDCSQRDYLYHMKIKIQLHKDDL